MATDKETDAKLQELGARYYETIAEMVANLDAVDEDGNEDDTARDEAREEIAEDPLAVQVRSDWCDVGENMTPGEFLILLATGGPAVRIVGELDQHGGVSRARLECQDWGTPWTEWRGTWAAVRVLERYASEFFHG